MEKSLVVPKNGKHKLIQSSTPRIIHKRNENICPKTCTWMFIAALFIIAPNCKQSKCPSSREWIKGVVLYPYKTGILFSNEKESTTNTYYHMKPIQKQYAKWEKPDPKDYVLYDSIYMECPWDLNLCIQKADWWLPGAESQNRDYLQMGMRKDFWGGVMEMF